MPITLLPFHAGRGLHGISIEGHPALGEVSEDTPNRWIRVDSRLQTAAARAGGGGTEPLEMQPPSGPQAGPSPGCTPDPGPEPGLWTGCSSSPASS